jgi:hypothetical protein
MCPPTTLHPQHNPRSYEYPRVLAHGTPKRPNVPETVRHRHPRSSGATSVLATPQLVPNPFHLTPNFFESVFNVSDLVLSAHKSLTNFLGPST